MKDDAQSLLAWWSMGVLPAETVVTWADRAILASDNPPEWLIELSVRGPHRYLHHRKPGWPQPRDLDYLDRFRAIVEPHSPDDSNAVQSFAEWVARAGMGEDPALPEAMVSYHIDHTMSFDTGETPLALAEAALRKFRPSCHDIATVLARYPSSTS